MLLLLLLLMLLQIRRVELLSAVAGLVWEGGLALIGADTALWGSTHPEDVDLIALLVVPALLFENLSSRLFIRGQIARILWSAAAYLWLSPRIVALWISIFCRKDKLGQSNVMQALQQDFILAWLFLLAGRFWNTAHLALLLHEELELDVDFARQFKVMLRILKCHRWVDLATQYQLVRKLEQLHQSHLNLNCFLACINVVILDNLKFICYGVTDLA